MDPKVVQHMALLMSTNCVRKTVLDEYVGDGKLTGQELESLMGEVNDKLYTFLDYLLNRSEEEKQLFLEIMNNSGPGDEYTPAVSSVFEEAVTLLRERRGS